MEEIINKVEKSGLIVLDLEDFYPEGKRVIFDLKEYLFEGLILKEKDFRQQLVNINWEEYTDKYVVVTCSADAIIPSWAYLLVSSYLTPNSKWVSFGSLEELERDIYTHIINELDIENFRDKKVIIKGCANKPVPQNAYLQIVNRIKPIVSLLMFGEACSTVPIYKRK